jgi:hypothetical protein
VFDTRMSEGDSMSIDYSMNHGQSGVHVALCSDLTHTDGDPGGTPEDPA